MTHHDPTQPEHEPQDQDGQVSETSQVDLEIGGADATDKSTGTAADHADQPRD